MKSLTEYAKHSGFTWYHRLSPPSISETTSSVSLTAFEFVDDGGSGTNRKTDASRIKDYVLGGGQGANFSAINVTGITTAAFVDATQLKVSGVSTFTVSINDICN